MISLVIVVNPYSDGSPSASTIESRMSVPSSCAAHTGSTRLSTTVVPVYTAQKPPYSRDIRMMLSRMRSFQKAVTDHYILSTMAGYLKHIGILNPMSSSGSVSHTPSHSQHQRRRRQRQQLQLSLQQPLHQAAQPTIHHEDPSRPTHSKRRQVPKQHGEHVHQPPSSPLQL